MSKHSIVLNDKKIKCLLIDVVIIVKNKIKPNLYPALVTFGFQSQFFDENVKLIDILLFFANQLVVSRNAMVNTFYNLYIVGAFRTPGWKYRLCFSYLFFLFVGVVAKLWCFFFCLLRFRVMLRGLFEKKVDLLCQLCLRKSKCCLPLTGETNRMPGWNIRLRWLARRRTSWTWALMLFNVYTGAR